MIKHTFHVIVNANSIVQQVIQIKNGSIKTCQYECKYYRTWKKYYSWNPSTCICIKILDFRFKVDKNRRLALT